MPDWRSDEVPVHPDQMTLPPQRPISISSEPWMRQRTAAKYLGVSVDTLRRRARDASLPVHRVGGVCLYRASELDAWLVSMADTDIARK